MASGGKERAPASVRVRGGGARSVWRVGVLTAIVGLAVGAGVGLVMADYPVPGTLAPSEGPSVVDVVSRVFEDPRSGSVVPVIGEEVTLDSPVEGMTRRSDCVPGEPIGSGDVVALVDDGPVLALALPSPLWRDLAVGDRGEDVQALQEVLVGLGYEVPVSGFYDWNMGQTVAKIWAGVGGAKDQTGFPSCNYSGLGFLVVRRFV